MKPFLTIGLAKGYLLKDSLDFFKKHDIEPEDYSGRQLIFFDRKKKVRFMILRPTDVPVYVESGVVDMGIAGLDIVRECRPEVIILKDLGFGKCRLVIATSSQTPHPEFANGLKVATKFVSCAQDYFKGLGLKVDLIKLYGSVELAAITGLSDVVVDLVATGQTLKENGLSEVGTIFESTAQLIVNPVYYSLNYSLVKDFS
ncbi:MAG: ATP phosphoribosyltransferase [Candidatus Margulisiibacteriota bacterium]